MSDARAGVAPRNVFITGGTGYVGRKLVAELARRGHVVRALVRHGSETKLPSAATAITGDAPEVRMTTGNRFSDPILQAMRDAKILGVRAGTEHRFTGVWVVVVENRVFVRSWNDKPTGWHQAFRKQPRGSVQIGEREIAVRARPTRSERLRDAVTQAFAEKYNTKASKKWVIGFAEAHRLPTTLELGPA